MNKDEANKKARKIYEEWQKKREQIMTEAKENGTWENVGLDSNNHLFKSVDDEAKEKLEKLSELVDK